MVGGGSGGHVTPVLAVLAEIKAERPRTELKFWCDRSFLASTRSLLDGNGLNVPVTAIASGKLRRYHGIPLWKQLLDIPTVLKNLRDGILIATGFIQSLVLLIIWWPDTVFTKGGFVCLPVGLAARLLRIPLVIHDSDAHPGLTNRVLSRHATRILTGAPVEYYPYDKAKTTYVGIPIGAGFAPLSPAAVIKAKVALGFDPARPLVVVTGGGLGARRLNDSVIKAAPDLLAVTGVLHITGTVNYDDALKDAPRHPEYKLLPFVSKNMNIMLGAADIVLARAGATTMLELASLHKATILVPNAQLTGDHQSKNAKVYADAGAAIVVSEAAIDQHPEILTEHISRLLRDPQERTVYESAIGRLAKPNAARDVAAALFATADAPASPKPPATGHKQ